MSTARPAWGKRSESGQEHHLAHHCADVSAAFERLIEEPALRARLERVAGRPLDATTRARLSLLVFLHDVGKLNAGFQTKWQSPSPLGWVGHVAEGALLLFIGRGPAVRDVRGALGIMEEMRTWGAATPGLLLATLAHHGRPIDPAAPGGDQREKIWSPIEDYDPVAAARAYGAALKQWHQDAFGDGPNLPDAPAFQHLFAGLVAIADQIASREPLWRAELDAAYPESARPCMAEAAAAVGFNAAKRRADLRAPIPDEMFGFAKLRPLQARLAEKGASAPLVILESETGSGKTEAALLHFKSLYAAGAVDALYFALPTRAAAVQLHRRVQRATRALFGDGFEAVLAVPGYLTTGDATGAPLGRFEVRWHDDPDQARRDARWAAETPRRFLAAEVGVGTVDQVLLSALQAKWAHFRGAALGRALLVVDEVHASDVYMARILSAVLDAHLGLGSRVLLMSATLGAAARAKWLGSETPPRTDAEALAYPALSLGGDGSPRTEPIPGTERVKTVAMMSAAEIDAPEAIARRALDAADAGARVLVIRNTVSLAIDTLEPIRELVIHEQ